MNFRNVERFVTSRPRSRRYLAVATTLMMAMTTQYLLAPVASATSVCRWINEKGQTELSDIVPDGYRSIVSCTHSEPIIGPSAKQRTDAETTQRRNAALNPPAKSASTQAASENAAPRRTAKTPRVCPGCPVLCRAQGHRAVRHTTTKAPAAPDEFPGR